MRTHARAKVSIIDRFGLIRNGTKVVDFEKPVTMYGIFTRGPIGQRWKTAHPVWAANSSWEYISCVSCILLLIFSKSCLHFLSSALSAYCSESISKQNNECGSKSKFLYGQDEPSGFGHDILQTVRPRVISLSPPPPPLALQFSACYVIYDIKWTPFFVFLILLRLLYVAKPYRSSCEAI